jgi:signal transduction histidine kinase
VELNLETAAWWALTVIGVAFAGWLWRLYRTDHDERRLVFAIAFAITSFNHLYLALGLPEFGFAPLLMRNLYFWFPLPVIFAIFLMVYETLLRRDLPKLVFKLFLLFIFISLPLTFIATSLEIFFVTLAQVLTGLIALPLLYMVVRYRDPSSILFFLAIFSFGIGGITQGQGIPYLSAFAFFTATMFLVLIFFVADRLGIPGEHSIGSYFALKLRLDGTLLSLKQRTRDLEVANRVKDDFMANMSHELRTPLNAIIGFTQLLQDDIPGKMNREQKESLDEILTSSDHLLKLVDELLDFQEKGRQG